MLHGYLTHPIPRERPVETYRGEMHTFELLQAEGKIPSHLFYDANSESFWYQYTVKIYHQEHDYQEMAFVMWMEAHPNEYDRFLCSSEPLEHRRSLFRRQDEKMALRYKNRPMLV
jgi:hypothetical protein